MRQQLFSLSGITVLVICAAPGLARQDSEPTDPAAQQVPPLTVGDRAPAIGIEHWVEGDAVQSLEPGDLYVIDFFTTTHRQQIIFERMKQIVSGYLRRWIT